MRITKITFKNFMGYKNLELPKGEEELPNGLILISGKNSYGKSSILQGVLVALFGTIIFKGRNAESFITYGETKAEIFIYFTLDNKKYYLHRKWGRTGSATLKLFESNNKGIYNEIKKFNIEDFFEISRDQALSTVFVRQGEVEELANKKGAELREMIIDLFRLNIIDDALNFLDKESKAKRLEKSNLESIRVPIERIKSDIERVKKQSEEFKKIINEKEKLANEFISKLEEFPPENIISNLESLYKEMEIAEGKYNASKNDFEKKIENNDLKSKDFSSIKKIGDELASLTNTKKDTEVKLTELENKRQRILKGLGKTKGRIEDLYNKKEKMVKSLKFTKHKEGKESAICPTCQSELTKDHYDKIIQEFQIEIEINQNKVKEINRIIDGFESNLNKCKKDLDEINKDITIINSLKGDFENYKKYELELNSIQKTLNEQLAKYQNKLGDSSLQGIKTLSIEIERLSIELKSIKKEIKEYQINFETSQVRIKELNEEIKRMHEIQGKIGELEVHLDHISKAKEFVRRFVTEYMVVKRLVKNIAIQTDKYIGKFTAGQYSELIIDLAGTKKTGLSLKIRDHYNGQFEPIEILSGGDKTALGIALRLAISELMSYIRPTKESPIRNPKIDFLLLDEPLAALDELRRERILKYLTKSKSFSQIFLITHTAIPPDIQTHKILVDKDLSTGISHAKFEKLIVSF